MYKLLQASVAQSVERLIRNQQITGSSPVGSFSQQICLLARANLRERVLGASQERYEWLYAGTFLRKRVLGEAKNVSGKKTLILHKRFFCGNI